MSQSKMDVTRSGLEGSNWQLSSLRSLWTIDTRLGRGTSRSSRAWIASIAGGESSNLESSQRFNNTAVAGLGLPPRDALIARYAERTGADLASVRWWEAFALWKTVVVVQQLHRRWVRGESTDPRMATVADRIPSLIAAATTVLEEV